MILNEGWLKRQFDKVSRDIREWPDWMRREAGFQESTIESKDHMDLSSSYIVESKHFPGVSFHLRRLSEGRRRAFSMDLAGVLAEAQDLQRQLAVHVERFRPLVEAKDEDGLRTNEDIVAAQRIQAKIEQIRRDAIEPVYVRGLLAGVDGLTIDGEAAGPKDADEFPVELYEEILDAARREMGMSETEKGN